jgi:xanthine dehydrogenase accessory factor
MSFDLFEQIYQLTRAGEPFALATVVRVEKPISAKPGDKAIIQSDGTLHGWIGGGCSQAVIVREAQKALQAGQSRFLRLVGSGVPSGFSVGAELNSAPSGRDGIVELPITCHSGGTMEVFIESVLPQPQLILFGNSPVAISLAQLAHVLNFEIVVCEPTATREQFSNAAILSSELSLQSITIRPISFIVIATQGHDDETALEVAARSDVPYIAFVASKKKLASCVAYLRERGMSDEQLARIKAPAGLDIGAQTPDEIAVSILAELIQVRRQSSPRILRRPAAQDAQPVIEARDVVCGMMVEIATARHIAEFRGQTYYFCGAGCKAQFEKRPEKFIA